MINKIKQLLFKQEQEDKPDRLSEIELNKLFGLDSLKRYRNKIERCKIKQVSPYYIIKLPKKLSPQMPTDEKKQALVNNNTTLNNDDDENENDNEDYF